MRACRVSDIRSSVNGRPLARGVRRERRQARAIDLSDVDCGRELVMEILSNKFIETARRTRTWRSVDFPRAASGGACGRRPRTATRKLLSPRHGVEGPWYMDDRKVFDDVLKSADTLERLYITGGEPLINDRVADILDYLSTGASRHIHLELSTNCTHVSTRSHRAAQKVSQSSNFSSASTALAQRSSTSGIRRVGASSTPTCASYKVEHGLICKVPPVVQVYNVLDLVDLYRYCDEMDMEVTMNILHMPSPACDPSFDAQRAEGGGSKAVRLPR